MQFLDRILETPISVDPLPAVVVGTVTPRTAPNGIGFHVLNSNLNIIGGHNSGTTAYTYTEAGQNFGYGNTSANPTTGSTYRMNNTGENTVNGSLCTRVPLWQHSHTAYAISQHGPYFKSSSDNIGINAYLGLSIGEYGNSPIGWLYSTGSVIEFRHRLSHGVIERVTLANTTHLNTTSEPGTTQAGQIGYNDRTRTLVLIRSASLANSYRAHVWVNPNVSLATKNSLETGRLNKFITDAKSGVGGASYYYNDFTWSTAGSTSTLEASSHMRVIVGDNNLVGLFRMSPNNQAIYGYITLNSGSTSTSVTALGNQTLTTTYGIETSNSLGAKCVVSWDQNWVAAYCPYYYYFAGLALVMFYTRDPSKFYTYGSTSSSLGFSVAPIGTSAFVMSNNDNTDGVGIRISAWDPEVTRASGRDQSGVIMANGANITPTSSVSTTNGAGDAFTSSTNYSGVVSLDTKYRGPVLGVMA